MHTAFEGPNHFLSDIANSRVRKAAGIPWQGEGMACHRYTSAGCTAPYVQREKQG